MVGSVRAEAPALDNVDPASLTTDQGQLCELPMSSDDLTATEQPQDIMYTLTCLQRPL